MTAEFGEPRLQAGLTQGSEAVERVCKIVQFRRHPGDDFEDGLMAGIQIPPVQDAFVVKDTVAKIADVLPAAVELGLISLRGGSVGKRLALEKRADAGAGVGVVEEPGPETEGELGDDAARGERFTDSSESGFGLRHLVLLPRGET